MKFSVLRAAALLAFFALTASAAAQSPARIGLIAPVTAAQSETRLAALKDGMRDVGLVEGQHYLLDVGYADGHPERIPALMQDLLTRKPEVLLVITVPSVRAAQQATKTVPILFVATPDPVGNGLVASLARPGGNTTGFTGQAEDLVAKQVELLREALPRARRLAVLVSPGNPPHTKMFDQAHAVAAGFGMSARAFEADTPAGLDAAFSAIAQHRPDALLILGYAMFYGERERILAFALKNRIPVIAPEAEFVDAGSLIAYGTPFTALFRHAATYVKKILAGAKPADLPVEQPTRFEMVINLRTAKALGITLPQTFLVRADRVIE